MQFHLILFEECRLSDGVGNLGIETVSDPVFASPPPPLLHDLTILMASENGSPVFIRFYCLLL